MYFFIFNLTNFHAWLILVIIALVLKIQLFVPLINSFVSFAPFMSSNEISVTNSQWYFYSVFPLWKRQTNLISCHFKTLTSKKCIIQFHTQGLRHALHILSSKTNAIRIFKSNWTQMGRGPGRKRVRVIQIVNANTSSQDLVFWCVFLITREFTENSLEI